MITIEHNIHIDRPIEEVWAYITDANNDTQYQSSLSEAYSDGPQQLGARVTRVGTVLGIRNESVSEITEFDPPVRKTERAVGGPIQFEIVMQFEEMGGGTHINIAANVDAGGVFKVAEGVLANQVQKQTKEDFDRLKSILEG